MWDESACLSKEMILPWSSKGYGILFMSPSRFREGKAIDRPAVRAYPDKGTGLLNSRVLSPYPDRLLGPLTTDLIFPSSPPTAFPPAPDDDPYTKLVQRRRSPAAICPARLAGAP